MAFFFRAASCASEFVCCGAHASAHTVTSNSARSCSKSIPATTRTLCIATMTVVTSTGCLKMPSKLRVSTRKCSGACSKCTTDYSAQIVFKSPLESFGPQALDTKGWHFCAVVPAPAPTLAPTSSPTVPFRATSRHGERDYCAIPANIVQPAEKSLRDTAKGPPKLSHDGKSRELEQTILASTLRSMKAEMTRDDQHAALPGQEAFRCGAQLTALVCPRSSLHSAAFFFETPVQAGSSAFMKFLGAMLPK